MRRISIAIAFALLLAACGGSDDSEQAAATPETAAAQDEAMSEDEAMSDEEMSDEAMTDESMSDEEMSEEEMTDEEMSDESMSEDEMSDESMTEGHTPTEFIVTITNTSDSAELATPLAPGAFIVHTSMETLFAEGVVDRSEGLEALAEDGDPSGLVAALGSLPSVSVSGAFTNPDDGAEAGPALPGSTYVFTFEAVPGDYLSLATMFVQSNDWFFATPSSGISLFEDGEPLSGDISEMIGLWDAGTETDETPGEGTNQAPRQTGPNTGEDQGAPIAPVAGYSGSVAVTISVAS